MTGECSMSRRYSVGVNACVMKFFSPSRWSRSPRRIRLAAIQARPNPGPFAEHCLQMLELRRLDEMRVEAGLLGAAAVAVLAPPGERHELYPAPLRVAPDLARGSVAVKLRHADVEERDVGPEGSHRLHRFETVIREGHLVPERSQQH